MLIKAENCGHGHVLDSATYRHLESIIKQLKSIDLSWRNGLTIVLLPGNRDWLVF